MCLPCWHLSPSRLFSVFSSMFVGDGKRFFLPHIHPCPEVPPSPLPLQEAKEGEGGGGQGSPSVLRLHRVFRLNQENFYYQKEKKEKKKKKLPAATFPPCPIGTVKTGSVGFLGGWLRAGTLSGKSGGVPWQALRQAHFGLLPSPHFFPLQATHQRRPSPPPGPWATGLYTGAGWGYCTALARVGGGTLAPSNHVLCSPSPELGISFHELLWGYLFPSSEVCAIFSHLSGGRRG